MDNRNNWAVIERNGNAMPLYARWSDGGRWRGWTHEANKATTFYTREGAEGELRWLLACGFDRANATYDIKQLDK